MSKQCYYQLSCQQQLARRMLGAQALAHEVACYLGLDLGGIKIKRFADGEIYVQVQVHCWSLAAWDLRQASPFAPVTPCTTQLARAV